MTASARNPASMDTASIIESSLSTATGSASGAAAMLGASSKVDPFDPIINWRFFVVPILAFFCEFVDSSLGMGYGTTLTPVLLTPNFGYERSCIVQSVLLSELATGVLATICHSMMSNLSLGCDATKLLPSCLRRRVKQEEEEDELDQAGVLQQQHSAEGKDKKKNVRCHPTSGKEIDLDLLTKQDAEYSELDEDKESVRVDVVQVFAPETSEEIERHQSAYYRLSRWLNKKFTVDVQTIVVMIIFGFFGTLISSIISQFYSYSAGQKFGIKVYIGVMILAMGTIIIVFTIIKKQVKYALWKISILGLVTGFNKGISGGGYGPLSVSGQLLCGRPERNAIATTSASEAVISFFGVITDFIISAIAGDKIDGKDYRLCPYLIIGSLLSVPFATYGTRIVRAKFLKWVVGCCTITLGIYSLISASLNYTKIWTAQ